MSDCSRLLAAGSHGAKILRAELELRFTAKKWVCAGGMGVGTSGKKSQRAVLLSSDLCDSARKKAKKDRGAPCPGTAHKETSRGAGGPVSGTDRSFGP